MNRQRGTLASRAYSTSHMSVQEDKFNPSIDTQKVLKKPLLSSLKNQNPQSTLQLYSAENFANIRQAKLAGETAEFDIMNAVHERGVE